MRTSTPGSGVPTAPAQENSVETGKSHNQECKRAAARLSVVSAGCAGTKELPRGGVSLREGVNPTVCLQGKGRTLLLFTAGNAFEHKLQP